MCIIAVGTRQTITEAHIRASMAKNKDGAFILIRPPGKKPPLALEKSFLVEDILRTYNEAPADSLIMFHARIATHGTVNVKNIHGWEEDGVYFCHNGVLSIKNRDDMTDSETFFRDLFMPVFRANKFIFNEKVENAVNAVIGTSRFAFYYKDTISMYGTYIEDGGASFSNDSYKERAPYVYKPYIPKGTRYKFDREFDVPGMEMDGDPYWGDDCLRSNLPGGKGMSTAAWDAYFDNLNKPVAKPAKAKSTPAEPKQTSSPTRIYFDPYDLAWFASRRPAPALRPWFI